MTPLTRHNERAVARQWVHQFPWRSCNQTLRGFCWRCFVREITGARRRSMAARRARLCALPREPMVELPDPEEFKREKRDWESRR